MFPQHTEIVIMDLRDYAIQNRSCIMEVFTPTTIGSAGEYSDSEVSDSGTQSVYVL